MVSRLRLRHFRLLVAIDDHRSLLKAGEEVALSQPGATKALQEIEMAIGEKLFVRTNRGIEPNEYGHCVIRYARLISSDLANLREEMSGLLSGHGGRLGIGTIMGAVPLTSLAVGRLLARQPAVSVQIMEGTSDELLHLLDDGRIDVAICRTSVSHRPFAYDTTPIHEEELVVVAGPGHPLRGRRGLEIAEVADCTWVVCAANMPMRRYAEREFQDAGLQFPPHVIETTSAFALVTLLDQVHGAVGLLSRNAADYFGDCGLVTHLPVKLGARSEPYYFVTPTVRSLPPNAALLKDVLLEIVGEAATPGEAALAYRESA